MCVKDEGRPLYAIVFVLKLIHAAMQLVLFTEKFYRTAPQWKAYPFEHYPLANMAIRSSKDSPPLLFMLLLGALLFFCGMTI
mmetsp:Transcript_4940/g.13852  ORF Transcript_4940/g.13852 Transcript_4940/m.13852 type:complete len:82 (-) Transcript_4940:40-285(-)